MRRITLILSLVAASVAVPSAAGATNAAGTNAGTATVATAPASITRVTVAKVNGVRVVRVRLSVTRHCDGVARLVRNGRVLASSAKVHLMPGARVLRIRVPAKVRAGDATVRVILTASGQRWVLKRSVRIPR